MDVGVLPSNTEVRGKGDGNERLPGLGNKHNSRYTEGQIPKCILIEPKFSNTPNEGIDLINAMPDSERLKLIEESKILSLSDKKGVYVKVDNGGQVIINVPDLPKRTVVSSTDTARAYMGSMQDTVTKSLMAFENMHADRTSIISEQEQNINERITQAKNKIAELKLDPKYIELNDKASQAKLDIEAVRGQIERVVLGVGEYNHLHQKDPGFVPKNETQLIQYLSNTLIKYNNELTITQNEMIKITKTEMDAIKKAESERLIFKKAQDLSLSKTQRMEVAIDILNNPMLSQEMDPSVKSAVHKYVKAEADFKNALSKSIESVSNNMPISKEMQADLTKKSDAMKAAQASFEKKYGKSMDDVIKTVGNTREDLIQSGGLKKEPGVISDAMKKLFNAKNGVIEVLPATTKPLALNVYVNEATGNFRIGEVFHQDSNYYANQAKGSLQQWGKPETLSYATAEAVKAGIDSKSMPDYLRERWCVAAANWGMLKRNLGDAIPDFPQFIKDITDNGFMKPENMELNGPQGGTSAVINSYMNGNGSFQRWNDDKSHPPLPQGDRSNPASVASARAEGYQVIADFLKKEQPLAITLRVKDDGSGTGHTISLQRNPMKDGRYTYTVVDGSQSTTVNGTEFDPENVSGSVLGNPKNDLNKYATYAPYNFDYIARK